MLEKHHYARVSFDKFKAFDHFSLTLKHFNILVGPNNAGKSTILAAFRILSAAIRRATSKRPEMLRGPNGPSPGYPVDLRTISVAEENIFYNYKDQVPATVRFKLSNGNELLLHFPEQGTCHLFADAQGKRIETPSAFKANFNCQISFVPILGPVEHNEPLYEKEAARLALFNYRAARNFRNIWYHYPEKFELFRSHLAQTWPGMDIEAPRPTFFEGKPRLHMFCIEDRIPREIFWAGFGFQIWCQMLTHLIQAAESSLFLIDEPDIYLHSELQRQLLSLLRDLGPDVLIATHSTEIISEADAEDIVLVNKRRSSGRRIQNAAQLGEVFAALGSNSNPLLTQLAKTRKAVFVEGKDFQILGRFARKLGATKVANRNEFAVVPVEGFSPDRIRNLKKGIELTLGVDIGAAVVLDRDYRSSAECNAITEECKAFATYVTVHSRKELESFLLVPSAIDRAVARKLADNAKRSGKTRDAFEANSAALLDEFCAEKMMYVAAQYITEKRRFERSRGSSASDASLHEAALQEFRTAWDQCAYCLVPAKEALSAVNAGIQASFKVSLTAGAIVDAMQVSEVPHEIRQLVHRLTEFGSGRDISGESGEERLPREGGTS